MKNFMEPESVALIGITRNSGPSAFNLMENMIKFGFPGDIYPVNPSADKILGKKAYSGVGEIKKKIDLAIISTPRQTTIDILKECVAANIKAAIVVNQGFNDADSRGKEMQREMSEMARNNGIRILGPNTLGVMNNFNNFTTSFMPLTNEKAPVGVICQSGIHFVAPREFSGKIGKAIDLGNSCDIGFYDALKYFGNDPDIKIIAIHMEGLSQGKEFYSLARKVVKEKPIIFHKTGSSEAGARAALSHSGSMAGNYKIYKAAFKQIGLTVLEAGGQMSDAVKTLLYLPVMKGNRVGVITYSGGAGIMGSDGVERYGLKLASLLPETIHEMAKLSPDWMPLGNPLDIWPAVMLEGARKAYSVALKTVLSDPNVDGVLCIALAPLPEFSFLDVSDALNEVMDDFPAPKPVVVWTYGPNTGDAARRFETKNKIMAYHTIERATWALSLLHDRFKSVTKESAV